MYYQSEYRGWGIDIGKREIKTSDEVILTLVCTLKNTDFPAIVGNTFVSELFVHVNKNMY